MDRTPYNLDRRSLELHRLIAQRIQVEPGKLQRARATLERWLAQDPRGCDGWRQWQAILDAGVGSAIEAMLADTDQGQYLDLTRSRGRFGA